MISVANKKDLDTELNKTRVTIALFYASWCPHCVRFVPFFDKQASCRRLGNVIHVLLDDYDNPLWDEYEISAVPTIILFEEGKICSRLDGKLGSGLKEEQFAVWLNEAKQT